MQYLKRDPNYIYLKMTNQEASRLGAHYVRSAKAFRLPITFQALAQVYEETLEEEVLELMRLLTFDMENTLAIKDQDDTEGDERLRPYQRVDSEFIKAKRNVAIFNEQRTGKTPTILTASKDYLGQGIVVCPASLKINWQMEYQNWVDDEPTRVISGSKTKRTKDYKAFSKGKYKMLFISYETLRADIDLILDTIDKVDVLIVDEAHRLRNYRTAQSKAVYRLGRMATHIYPMTGTPAVNHPSDVYGILRLLQPDKYTSYWQFIERYFGYTEGRFGRELLDVRPDRANELTEVLYNLSTQRKRNEVMKWIPKITERSIPVELKPIQYRHLKKIKEEFMAGELEIPNVIAQITRLRQVSLDPGLLDLDGQSAKTDFIKEFMDDNDGKIVVFSSFTSYLKKLKEIFADAELLTGEQTQEQKQAAVDAVQHGDSKLLLSNIQVGGTGWTLDNVDTIIFTDKSYNPIDNEQAADRIVPTDPNKTYGAKQIITLIGKNTIEESIHRLLKEKINIIEFVNNYGLNALVDYGKGENNNNASVSNKR